jgi:hypothetical protein
LANFWFDSPIESFILLGSKTARLAFLLYPPTDAALIPNPYFVVTLSKIFVEYIPTGLR